MKEDNTLFELAGTWAEVLNMAQNASTEDDMQMYRDTLESIDVLINDKLEEYQRLKKELEVERAKNKAYGVRYENKDEGEEPTAKVLKEQDIIIAPEIKPDNRPKYPKYMFNEELNNDVAYSDDDYVKNGRPENLKRGDYAVGHYGHQTYLDKKVVATTGGPLQNVGKT
ncbi:unnamed protein product [Cylicocyclus nassatus]|uniref:Uncharacterized protein n=1 Tax=Cylicocyclus nassatus TaxID=53992 RepID=A0AA36M469_CYLNA|nr:unnamed protein product [Cylicocyclus nassatus]